MAERIESSPDNAALGRRQFLPLGLGGLTLSDVLRLRAQSKSPSPSPSPRAVIMICLAGGPSHMDTYDMKPNAPADFRGEFKPIQTNVPGFDICEHMPMQAKIADKLALVRSLQFVEPTQHELEEVFSGFPKAQKRPSFGAIVSRFRCGDSKLPSYISEKVPRKAFRYELKDVSTIFVTGRNAVESIRHAKNGKIVEWFKQVECSALSRKRFIPQSAPHKSPPPVLATWSCRRWLCRCR